jgi:hypothetical protein
MKRIVESNPLPTEFTSLPLHDAILHTLSIEWKARRCVAELEVFVDPGKDAIPRLLIWHGVTALLAPHQDPWGPSVSVNSAFFEPPNTYVLEMQSGDEIRITAKRCELVTSKA